MDMFTIILISIFVSLQKGDTYEPEIIPSNIQAVTQIFYIESNVEKIQEVLFFNSSPVLVTLEIDREEFDGNIRFWDVNKRILELSRTFTEFEFKDFSISSDETFLIGANSVGQIRAVNLSDINEKVIVYEGETVEINHIAVSPDNVLLAVSSGSLGTGRGSYSFRILNLENGKEIFSISKSCGEPCYGLGVSNEFSSVGNFVAFATSDLTLRLLNVSRMEEVAEISNFALSTDDIIFTSNEQHLVYIANDGIRVWNIEAALETPDEPQFRVMATPETGQFITAISLNPAETILAIGYIDGSIEFWDFEKGIELHRVQEHTARVLSLDFNADGTLLASGGADGTIRLWGIANP